MVVLAVEAIKGYVFELKPQPGMSMDNMAIEYITIECRLEQLLGGIFGGVKIIEPPTGVYKKIIVNSRAGGWALEKSDGSILVGRGTMSRKELIEFFN